MVDESLTVNLPEKLDKKVTFASYTMEDLMRGGAFLIFFIAIGFLTGSVVGEVIFTLIGLLFFWLFGLTTIDGMRFHQYLSLKFQHSEHPSSIGVSTLKVFEDGVVFDGNWYKIIEVVSPLSLDFLNYNAKVFVFGQFFDMLNKSPHPVKFLVHSWRVEPDAFDDLINTKDALAKGYKKLIIDNTKNLYMQSYYILVIANRWDVKGATEEVRYKRASTILNIYTNNVLKLLNSMGMRGEVLVKPAEIYGLIKEVLRSGV